MITDPGNANNDNNKVGRGGFKSNSAQNYLNISANDRHMFREKMASGQNTKYTISELKNNLNLN